MTYCFPLLPIVIVRLRGEIQSSQLILTVNSTDPVSPACAVFFISSTGPDGVSVGGRTTFCAEVATSVDVNQSLSLLPSPTTSSKISRIIDSSSSTAVATSDPVSLSPFVPGSPKFAGAVAGLTLGVVIFIVGVVAVWMKFGRPKPPDDDPSGIIALDEVPTKTKSSDDDPGRIIALDREPTETKSLNDKPAEIVSLIAYDSLSHDGSYRESAYS